jgi:hypothetical protein
MKLSTFILAVEHCDDEKPEDVILRSVGFRSSCGDWVDFIDTKDVI